MKLKPSVPGRGFRTFALQHWHCELIGHVSVHSSITVNYYYFLFGTSFFRSRLECPRIMVLMFASVSSFPENLCAILLPFFTNLRILTNNN